MLVNQVRDWVAQMFVWDQAEKQTIARAAMAQGFNLPDAMYARPFPGSVSSLSVQTQAPAAQPTVATPKPARGVGTLAKVGLGAALALGAGGLGSGITALLMNRTPAALNTATGFGLQLEQSKTPPVVNQ